MSPADAVAAVRTADQAYYDSVETMHAARGAAFQHAQADSDARWREKLGSRRALRDHVYETYGVGLSELMLLSQG